MIVFPQNKIIPINAKFSGVDGDVSIEIFLEPFELSFEDYSENVNTSIRLDGIEISSSLNKLQGKKFDFPVNPDTGYIEGSIYFFSAHNPVDITSIIFGKLNDNKLPIKLYSSWVLEYENTGFKNFEKTVETHIVL